MDNTSESVLVQMLKSKPLVLKTPMSIMCSKRVKNKDTLRDDDLVLTSDDFRRWTKKRRILGKSTDNKKFLSSGEDDSGTEPGSSSSSSGSPSDGECCECPNDSGCDEEDDECDHEAKNKIEELCWQLEENFKENTGFFRRSIQQKIQYRPCTKNQQCMIQRVNRNRCQYCRLKKCIAVGMSRDAVRFGRVPKREKARIEAAMQQSTRNRAITTNVWTDLEDLQHVIDTVVGAHLETCEFTRDRVHEMKIRAKDCPNYTEPTRACPLNPAPEIQSEQEFSQRFADVIRGVIEFAGKIPGFELLTQGDKFTLLKAGLFDALFVRLIGMFDTSMDSIICLNGQLMRRNSIQNGANARFLVDSTFKFAERINAMQLTDAEIALFCAVVLVAPDRHGIRNYELINRMHAKLKQCLQHVISKGRPSEPEFMGDLMNTIGDLKTLSTLHTEKLIVFRNELSQQLGHEQQHQQQVKHKNEITDSTEINHHHFQSAQQTQSERIEMTCQQRLTPQPSDISMSTISSSDSSSPHIKCPTKQSPILLAKLQGCPMGYRQKSIQPQLNHPSSNSSAEDEIVVQQCPTTLTHPNIPAGTTITAVTRPIPSVNRKLESPTDSGIESGSDGSIGKIGSGSSSCSSPRSSLEDGSSSLAESLPTLKRALEKPAIFDPHMYHKKFRRCPMSGESLDGGQSQLQTILTNTKSQNIHCSNNTVNSGLAVTHSILAGTLKTAPKMSDEHRKNQEILNRFIDQGGVIKTSKEVLAKVQIAPVDHEGTPLNLSKKTSAVTANSDETKMMVEA
ncbi:CLUMA_CG020875, isoform A [Clunio marinus]|uniref:CLUMA_CG020875, isoform A n=1 Tax=Clunio marinus TaxID=568069 RepID=A0A1J1J993_9DIPT|nr:CLUMA_CG020875, isoform A [Clunio marinus]